MLRTSRSSCRTWLLRCLGLPVKPIYGIHRILGNIRIYIRYGLRFGPLTTHWSHWCTWWTCLGCSFCGFLSLPALLSLLEFYKENRPLWFRHVSHIPLKLLLLSGLAVDSSGRLPARDVFCAGLRRRLGLFLSILCLVGRIEWPIEGRHIGILLWCPLGTIIIEPTKLPL